MNIIDFLYDNYLWIIAILVIAIFTIIGFIADRKSKGKNGKGNENISTTTNNVQAKVVPTEVPTPSNIDTNMNMGSMPNNNYQNANYSNMPNNEPNFATNMPPINNMNTTNNIPNNFVNGGVVNPTNQVPNMGMNGNVIPNNFTNPMPTNEQNINQVNQMMPNENIPQGSFANVMPNNNQNVSQVNNGIPNVKPVPEPTPVYNNQAFASENPTPNMVVNSWDEPKPVNPVNINQGFNQNNVSNIPVNNLPSQIPIQESMPTNTIPNNMQQPVNPVNNNMPTGNSVPGLNFMYGPSQNNNNNLQ